MMLFDSLPKSTIEKLSAHMKVRYFKDGEYLMKENESSNFFFIIEEGEVEIIKGTYPIGILYKDDFLGESALIGRPRNASARAKGNVKTVEFPTARLAKILTSDELSKIKSLVFEREFNKLSRLNQVASLSIKQNYENVKAKENMGRFIVYVLTLIFLYVFTIQAVTALKLNLVSSSVVSIPILLIMGCFMFLMMLQSGYPLTAYGFRFKGGVKALVWSGLWTIPVLLFLTLGKWILIQKVPQFSSLQLFHMSPALSPGAAPVSNFEAAILVLAYTVFVPVQEVIFRGAMQSSLQLFHPGRGGVLQAILISNIPFCMIHFHLSLILVVLTYCLGSFWGWMYAKQKTLIASCFSHFIIGLYAFFIIGIQDVLVI